MLVSECEPVGLASGSSSGHTWPRLNGNFLVARMAWSVVVLPSLIPRDAGSTPRHSTLWFQHLTWRSQQDGVLTYSPA